MAKVWLITGAGNGLGRDIAETALAAGEIVVAGARRVQELSALVEQYGSRIHRFQLDVRDEVAARAAVQDAVERFGRLDLLVNNAGYGYLAPFEQISSEDFKDVIDTCFWGVVFLTRAALPIMRKQRSGCILQISSIGGRASVPGNSPYHAAKFAVGGFSDSVRAEVAHLGIKVCTLEPGSIRTNWAARAGENTPELWQDYESSVGPLLKMLAVVRNHSEGDPKRIAKVILDLAEKDEIPARLILGVDAEKRVRDMENVRNNEAEKWHAVTVSTVYPDSIPLEQLLKDDTA